MPAERYYYPQPLENGKKVLFKDQEYHHLINVMRAHIGEEIEIVNGMGQLAQAVVDSLEKKSASLLLKSVQTSELPNLRMILAQAIPRQNRLEFIIEKGTELGMTEIWLFPATLSEKREISENQLQRFTTLTIAAMKQCGRLFLPQIIVKPPLKQWKDLEVNAIFFGATSHEAPPLLSLWQKISPIKEAIMCIGPEGGFTEDEIAIFHRLQAHGVKLHPNILRTETAAIAALTLLSHQIYYGDG